MVAVDLVVKIVSPAQLSLQYVCQLQTDCSLVLCSLGSSVMAWPDKPTPNMLLWVTTFKVVLVSLSLHPISKACCCWLLRYCCCKLHNFCCYAGEFHLGRISFLGRSCILIRLLASTTLSGLTNESWEFIYVYTVFPRSELALEYKMPSIIPPPPPPPPLANVYSKSIKPALEY